MSARQQTSGGWEAIQVSAAVGHGNSGGPVFNKYGEVVGLLTFGSEDKSQPGNLIQGFNFIVPNTVVNEFIAEAGVTPEMSATSMKFREALQLQADEKFKKAVAALEEVQSSNSRFPYLDRELADARSKAAANSNWFLDIWDYMDTKTRIIAGILALSALVWGGRKIFG
jgi:hypothetical protein